MVTDRRVVERGSAPLLKIMRMLGGTALKKEDIGKVRPYQLKKNVTSLCWLSPLFNTFTYKAVVSKLLPELQKWTWPIYFLQQSPLSGTFRTTQVVRQ